MNDGVYIGTFSTEVGDNLKLLGMVHFTSDKPEYISLQNIASFAVEDFIDEILSFKRDEVCFNPFNLGIVKRVKLSIFMDHFLNRTNLLDQLTVDNSIETTNRENDDIGNDGEQLMICLKCGWDAECPYCNAEKI